MMDAEGAVGAIGAVGRMDTVEARGPVGAIDATGATTPWPIGVGVAQVSTSTVKEGVAVDVVSSVVIVVGIIAVTVVVKGEVVSVAVDAAIKGVEVVVVVIAGKTADDTTGLSKGLGAVVCRFFANQSLMYSRRSFLYSSFCASVMPDRCRRQLAARFDLTAAYLS